MWNSEGWQRSVIQKIGNQWLRLISTDSKLYDFSESNVSLLSPSAYHYLSFLSKEFNFSLHFYPFGDQVDNIWLSSHAWGSRSQIYLYCSWPFSLQWIAGWVQFRGRFWMGALGAGKSLSPFWDISCLLFLVMCHFYQVAVKWAFAFLWNVLRNRSFSMSSVFLCVSLTQWLHTSF